jgi:serine/threonine-protein kinase
VGSVHYFSPEQARGGFVDEKSDLYSIGITLYEMVTGKIPFDGDTPVSVALKHIQDTPVAPKVLKDTIPAGVNDIIMKAIKKDQNIRYQKATEMLEDLYRVLKQPEGGFVDNEEDSGYSTKRVGIIDENIVTETDKQNKNGKKKGKLKYWLVGAGALVFLLLIVYVGFRLVTTMIEPPNDYVVTNYVGRDITSVEKELSQARIPYEIRSENSNNIKKDIIIAQDKKVGNTLKAGGFEKITLTVSDGVKLLKMPDYSSVDPRIAVDGLVNLGVNRDLIVQKEVNSDTVKSGLVIDTSPAYNTEFKLTDTVTINVSKGPKVKNVSVPNLFGKTYLQAEQLLTAAGLIVGKIDQPTGSSDFIASQSPASGTKIKEGSPVDIYFQRTVTWTVELKKPNKYPDSFNVTVYIRPSDTGTLRTIYNNTNIKSDFPLTFSIPVPTNGSTKADIYVNDELLSTITLK